MGHYTLTQGDAEEVDDEVKDEQSLEPKEDDYFDPFAIEDNNKKFGNIENEQKLQQTLPIEDDADTEQNETLSEIVEEEKLEQTQDIKGNVDMNNEKDTSPSPEAIEEKLEQTLVIDDDDDDEEEDDDDDDLRKEMEEHF